MLRLILPIILIGIAITGFAMVISPSTKEIKTLNAQVASYNEALDNAKELEAEREKLTQKFNSMNPSDISKLEKLLPDSVDNIKLVLEVEKLATPYGMFLRDVKYDTLKKEDEKDKNTEVYRGSEINIPSQDNYGTWDLEFSVEGSYTNFLGFLKDLERNLRVMDISSIQFSSVSAVGNSVSANIYKYGFKVKTYWLKN